MQLIYLSPVTYASFAQRPHKFVEWFHTSTGKDVLWIEPYPTRLPILSDFSRLKTRGIDGECVYPAWLKIIRIPAFPIEPLPGSGYVNYILWAKALDTIEAFSNQHETLLTIGKPSVFALAVLYRLKSCRSIYDAMDDFPAFYSGISRRAMRRREEELVSRVSMVWASSTELKHRWSTFRDDVSLVHNGFDSNLLPQSKTRSELKDNKVFGYVGTIAEWFDWEWLIALAKARSSNLVRLIGPVYSKAPSDLPQNIEILPPCSHADALLAMLEFDVGLIPFKKNKLTQSVDPIKYYEYRALNLPVISTSFGEMAFRDYEEGTFISHDIQDISGLVENALSFVTNSTSARQFLASNSWNARFNAIKLLNGKVHV